MTDNNNFIIDTNLDFAKLIPEKWIEPLLIISKIRGYRGIDDYILALIESRLQMFVDTSDTIEFAEFQEYMHNTMIGKDVPNQWVRNAAGEFINKEEEEEQESETEAEEPTKKEGTPADFIKKIHDDYYNKKKVNSVDKEKEASK
jgi:hypothetical protein